MYIFTNTKPEHSNSNSIQSAITIYYKSVLDSIAKNLTNEQFDISH